MKRISYDGDRGRTVVAPPLGAFVLRSIRSPADYLGFSSAEPAAGEKSSTQHSTADYGLRGPVRKPGRGSRNAYAGDAYCSKRDDLFRTFRHVARQELAGSQDRTHQFDGSGGFASRR